MSRTFTPLFGTVDKLQGEASNAKKKKRQIELCKVRVAAAGEDINTKGSVGDEWDARMMTSATLGSRNELASGLSPIGTSSETPSVTDPLDLPQPSYDIPTMAS